MTLWKTASIQDLGEVITGKTPSSEKPEEFGIEYPFITPSDISVNQRLITTERALSEKGLEAHKRLLLPEKSICIVCIGATIGKVCMTDRPSFSNQQINSIIPAVGKHDPHFVYYLSTSLKNTLLNFAGGSATPIINKSAFSSIKVLVPEYNAQQKIAAVLSAYDDLIENNKRRIALLEKMAEEIYREWFVRMRFPGHEKVKFDKGVPQVWNIESIGNICEKVTDGSHLSPEMYCGGKYMASVKDMHSTGFSLKSIKTISSLDFEKLVRADCKPQKNDILIAKDGSYLKHVFVWNHNYDVVILSSIAILRPNLEKVFPYFLSLMLKQESTISMMSGYVSGSALPRIILDDFKKMKILMPDYDLIRRFDALVKPLYENIIVVDHQIEVLQNVRDKLLSRLISGKLSVENIDIHFPLSMQNEIENAEKESSYA